MVGIQLIATGRAMPKKEITNDDLSKIVDTNDEWISTRTGIKSRHFCEDEQNWQIALEAATKAIEKAGIEKSEIGILVVATFTPDYATPSVSCILQKELGLDTSVAAFDINAACSGFLYALKVANGLLTDEKRPYALVIGSEQISSRMNMEDRGTCVLFGDGAGAAVIRRNPEKRFVSILGANGDVEALGCYGHTSDTPYIYMDGKRVFKFAVQTMTKVAEEVLDEAGLTLDDIDYVVCHQANERIIRTVMKQLHAPEEKFFINIQNYGNTSAASIPIALDEMNEQGKLQPGSKLLCVAFGAGFTWGGTLIEI